MAMLPLQCGEMGAFYRIWGPMELSAVIGYTTNMPSLKAKKLRKLPQEKVLLEL
jgi:hypothetical protein